MILASVTYDRWANEARIGGDNEANIGRVNEANKHV